MFLSGRPAKVCRVNQYQIFSGLSVRTGYMGNEKRWIHRRQGTGEIGDEQSRDRGVVVLQMGDERPGDR